MAVLVLAPLAAGVLAGYALGGRLRGLAGTPIRAPWLLWFAAGLQLVYFRWHGLRAPLESWLGVPLTVPVFGLVGTWVLVNLPRRPRPVQLAAGLILLGGAMNATVIAANGRMPYSTSAVPVVEAPADVQAKALASAKYVPAGERTGLRGLGDDIPVAPLGKIVSLGDLVLLTGVAALIAAAMRAGAGTRSGQACGPTLTRPTVSDGLPSSTSQTRAT